MTKNNNGIRKSVKLVNGWLVNNNPDIDMNKIQNFITISENSILYNYTNKIWEFNVEDDDLEISSDNDFKMNKVNRIDLIEKIINYIRGILVKFDIKDNIRFKLVSVKYTYIISIMIENGMTVINTFKYDNELMLLTVCFDRIGCSYNIKEMYRYESTPFYLSRKERDVSKLISKYDNGKFTDNNTLKIIYNSLKMIFNKCEIETSMNRYTRCSKTEMYFINKIFEKRYKNNIIPVDIRNWIKEDIDYNDFKFMEKSNMLKKLKETVLPNNNSYPIIDLSLKDIDYINKYLLSLNLFDKCIDLNKHISFPYGNMFRYIIDADGESYTINIVITKDDENDYMRITISYDVNDSIRIFSYVEYIDIRNFNSEFVKANTSMLILNNKHLYTCISDVENDIPCIFLEPYMISNISLTIIGLCIILNDQPSKMRMIKCTKHDTNNSIKKNNGKKNNEEFIVTRILTTSKGVNRCIQKMKSTYGDVDKGYEYVLESWARKGYYRTDSNGKEVWIPPTICHRHLPLTEKEIHIKL